MKNDLFTTGLPEIHRGMRIEERVRVLDGPYNGKAYSQCLVAADGTEIATIATDDVPEVRRLLS